MTGIRPVREWRRFAACRGLPTALFYPRPDAPAGDDDALVDLATQLRAG